MMLQVKESKLDNFDVTVEWIEKTQSYYWLACGGVTIESLPFFKSSFECKEDWKVFAKENDIQNWESRNW